MTDTFRAMCAELVELSAPVDSIPQLTERLQKLSELADRARALLDQQPVSPPYKLPEAEGPTDEELWELYQGPGSFSPVEFARAVLARWGRPTPQPVAMSERQPGPEDCDEQGRCWCWWWDCEWVLVEPRFVDFRTAHWLPANALPTPRHR